MDQIRIFSPATVANVSCGYDAMAFALDTLGDEMVIIKNDSGQVVITRVDGAELPFETNKNSAGVVASQMLTDAGSPFGVDIEIIKKYKPGSGLGSSAASSSGTAFAVNKFLDGKYSKLELLQFARLGEEVACGSPIADNVAAALYGGFVLIRSYDPLDIISIPTPSELVVTVIHPQIEVNTEDARKILPEQIPMKTAIAQWSNVGGLISGLHTADFDLIGRSLTDHVAEPHRKIFIPHFDQLKDNAMASGALGAGISGSGPSVFALSKGEDLAQKVASAWDEIYKNSGIDYKIYVSKINKNGVQILND
ncbi:MAG: homoserine kinase [Flavobacteriaceae bacterium]|nr:homoserine kinase [Flavobacteriaceae bacterium]